MLPEIEHTFIATNGIRLHVVQAGPVDGPLVLLLHGFPEFWYGWRHQIAPLAQAGYRVWVPDQRGYNLSDKPGSISEYQIEHLAADILGLILASGRQKITLIGHDWGAAVAWWVALRFPQFIERLVILNVPHPQVMLHTLRHSLAQLRKSWYIFAFQIPGLEAVLRNNNWALLARALQASARPEIFGPEDLQQYRQAWWRKDAVASMLNWYRAAVRYPPRLPANVRIHVPTLILWGVHDIALGREMAQPSLDLCDQGQLVFFENATHWVQHDEAQQVNQHILEFLRS